jgi:hypothetical protein
VAGEKNGAAKSRMRGINENNEAGSNGEAAILKNKL